MVKSLVAKTLGKSLPKERIHARCHSTSPKRMWRAISEEDSPSATPDKREKAKIIYKSQKIAQKVILIIPLLSLGLVLMGQLFTLTLGECHP